MTAKEMIQIPIGLNTKAWDEWVDYRKKVRRKPVSAFAANRQFKMLLKYSEEDQQKIIDHSMDNDYQGLFELKGGQNERYSIDEDNFDYESRAKQLLVE